MPASTVAPTSVPSRDQKFTIAVSGDILPHSRLWRGAAENAANTSYDFRPMFELVKPTISSVDLA
ncbi:MAG: CapA family protein, partial [Actinomycetota bacterium]